MKIQFKLLMIVFSYIIVSFWGNALASPKNKIINGKIPPGILLQGEPSAKAKLFLNDYTAQLSEKDMVTFKVPNGAKCYSAMLAAIIKENATVDQVNTVLKQHNSRIGNISRGSLAILLQIPPQATVKDLQNLLEQLKNTAAFEAVVMSCKPVPQ